MYRPKTTSEITFAPDGLQIAVAWGDMRIGESVFVPCVNVKRAQQRAHSVAQQLSIRLATQIVIEDGYLGLRIWRAA